MTIEVLLAPVAIRARGADGKAQLVGLVAEADEGTWPSVRARESDLAGAKQELLRGLPLPAREIVEALALRSQPVSFIEQAEGSRLTLVYTMAISSPMVDPVVERLWHPLVWRPLVRNHGTHKAAAQEGWNALGDVQHAELVVDYWRQRLEERAAFAEFLPRYVTNPQVRDVYSAVWGFEQDPTAFSRWSGLGDVGGKFDAHGDVAPALGSFVVPVQPHVSEVEIEEAVTDEFSRFFERLSSAADVEPLAARSVARGLSTAGYDLAKVITEPRSRDSLMRMGGDACAPLQMDAPAVLAVTAVAAEVIYRKRARGQKPNWFRVVENADPSTRLNQLYQPRPSWNSPPKARTPAM